MWKFKYFVSLKGNAGNISVSVRDVPVDNGNTWCSQKDTCNLLGYVVFVV